MRLREGNLCQVHHVGKAAVRYHQKDTSAKPRTSVLGLDGSLARLVTSYYLCGHTRSALQVLQARPLGAIRASECHRPCRHTPEAHLPVLEWSWDSLKGPDSPSAPMYLVIHARWKNVRYIAQTSPDLP